MTYYNLREQQVEVFVNYSLSSVETLCMQMTNGMIVSLMIDRMSDDDIKYSIEQSNRAIYCFDKDLAYEYVRYHRMLWEL